MEIARRVGLNVVGVPLPGQFMVRHEPAGGMKPQLIDVYAGGKLVSEAEASKIVEKITGEPPTADQLKATSKKEIILRMLRNLANVAERERDLDGMLHYLDAIVAAEPQSHDERWVRAVLRWKAGRQRDSALADLDWLIEQSPAGVDLDRVRELRRILMPGKRE
jgi:regulator of sirC expression with transglutaminase-like and TPR domain